MEFNYTVGRDVQMFLYAVDAQQLATDMQLSPIWVPDANAPVCMVCNKTAFNIFSRRVRAITLITIQLENQR